MPHLPQDFPNWQDAEIALIGLEDYRGMEDGKTCSFSANAIRNQLYQLTRNTSSLSIVDFGNLRTGFDQVETRYRLREMCGMLLEHNILPVIFGGSNDLAYGQILSYEKLGFPIEWINIDAKLDYDISINRPYAECYLYTLLESEQHLILHYHHMAHQTYLTEPIYQTNLSECYNFNFTRLGELKQDLTAVEPAIRKADAITFDLNAVAWESNPANPSSLPFGLSAEEAVRLAGFAGASQHVSSIGFYGYLKSMDQRNVSANLQAVMIWHFLEGYLSRPSTPELKKESYHLFEVIHSQEPKKYTFFQHKVQRDKWWLRTETEAFGTLDIPCLQRDYLEALDGQVPEAWLKAIKKYEYI